MSNVSNPPLGHRWSFIGGEVLTAQLERLDGLQTSGADAETLDRVEAQVTEADRAYQTAGTRFQAVMQRSAGRMGS